MNTEIKSTSSISKSSEETHNYETKKSLEL